MSNSECLTQRRNRNMFVERSNIKPLYYKLENEFIPELVFRCYQDSNGSEAIKRVSTPTWGYDSYGLWSVFWCF